MLLHYNKGLVRQFVWRCKHLGTEVAFGELALAGDDALIQGRRQMGSKQRDAVHNIRLSEGQQVRIM